MNILILTASTGGGHLRAAASLKSYIAENSENNNVKVIDALEYINPILNKTITEGYEQMAKKVPKLFGSLYKSSNKENILGSFLAGFMAVIAKYLLPLIESFDPQIIITTHPFVTTMVSNLKEHNKISQPLICIMTDYAPHKTWINKCVDSYIVSNEGMIDVMVKMGADKEKIHPFGIPIDDAFYTIRDKDEILKEIGLESNVLTILIMAGSFGVTDIVEIYNDIVKIDLDFQIIVITGKNKKLYDMFQKRIYRKPKITTIVRGRKLKRKLRLKRTKKARFLRKKFRRKNKSIKPTRLLYFTNEVDKYMQVSDLIITKPGGLTISEALACNLPMAIFDAIPGQEEENAEFLINNNMAVKIGKGKSCTETIEKLLTQDNTLEYMKASCRSFDKSASSENIFMEISRLTCEVENGK